MEEALSPVEQRYCQTILLPDSVGCHPLDIEPQNQVFCQYRMLKFDTESCLNQGRKWHELFLKDSDAR
ncbi:hypothetical protein SAMN05444955_108132 [Lihuaxuella thermophila]|uniref:Uncharacterized protein n=1 Tax=Lihuaxuella thermophila TaxID=1173111 RepID=A0A1H8FCE6_9BACL|nr:hypothetical protein SAMN05444955_108132 [Lihuaxuella thermophila]